MSTYVVNEDLKAAIASLFDQHSMALDPLGVGDAPASHYLPDISTDINPAVRVGMLKRTLEEFVINMAKESEEIGCSETTDTFRMQSIGLFIALRELNRHFPE